MKHLLACAAVLATLAAAVTPAAAEDVNISASVTAKCSTLAFPPIAIASDVTGADGQLVAATINGQSSSANAFCNGAGTTITISKTNLTNGAYAGAPPTGFTKSISYAAGVTVVGNTVTSGNTVGVFDGAVAVTLSGASAAGDRPVAGSYSGAVTVTLTPGV